MTEYTLDLLESTHSFPCTYTFKAICISSDSFAEEMMEIICRELSLEKTPPHGIRMTAARRHMCVSITPPVQSANQIIDVYQKIKQLEGLVMLL